MLLQDYLDLDDLAQCVNGGYVHRKEHPDLPLIMYTYSREAQFDSYWTDAARKCRGLIVEQMTGRIVAFCMPKFFNKNEHDNGKSYAVSLPEEPVRIFEKLDGCFPAHARLNLWNGGTVSIGEVVKKKLTPTLIGRDAEGNLVPSKVTSWHYNGLKSQWLALTVDTPVSLLSGAGGTPNRIIVTPNHSVFTARGELPASDIKEGDILYHYAPSFKGLDLFLGGLLGDGSVCRNGSSYNYQECHGENQRQYTYDQRALFSGGLVNSSDTKGGYADTTKVWLTTRTAETFKRLREEWYPEGTKVVPGDLSFMNDAVVAKWYMDDGSLSHNETQNDRALFHTNGFTEEDVRRLASKLTEMYGVHCTVFDAKGWVIRVNYKSGSINALWEAIAPYVFPSMQYKLPEEFRGKFTGFPPVTFSKETTPSRVVAVEYGVDASKQANTCKSTQAFDISTETHNYMCAGVLVHNSMGTVYFYEGVWRVATKGSFLSDQAIKAAQMLQAADTRYLVPGVTYVAEIVYPDNRIVVDYGSRHDLVLLTSYLSDGREVLRPESWAGTGFSYAPELDLMSLGATIGLDDLTAENLLDNGTEAEGYVVRFDSGLRVKMKFPEYLALHKILTNCTERTIWEALYHNHDMSKFRENVPDEFDEWVDDTSSWILSQVMSFYHETARRFMDIIRQVGATNRKAFAQEAAKLPADYKSAMFLLYDGKSTRDLAFKRCYPKATKAFKQEDE